MKRDPVLDPHRIFDIDEWKLPQACFDSESRELAGTVFCQSNGYFAVPGTLENDPARERARSGGFIAGLYELQTDILTFIKGKPVLPDSFHRVANTPDFLHLSLAIDGQVFSEVKPEGGSRYLDMKTGALVRRGLWEGPGRKKLQVEIRRVACLRNPHLFVYELSMTPLNFDGCITITSRIDAKVNSYYLKDDIWTDVNCFQKGGGEIGLSARTQQSRLPVEVLCRHDLDSDGDVAAGTPVVQEEEQSISVSYECPLKRNATRRFEKKVWIQGGDALECSTEQDRRAALDVDCKATFAQSGEEWVRFWEAADIRIDGDPAAQQGVRYCLFQLRQAYRDGLRTSVTAKGLTGEGYGLLCFWDAEIYNLPFYIYNFPELAKQMLMYRHSILDGARERARTMGYKGAMYPFMAVYGEDNPGAWECVLGEQHINAAIPYAVHHYVVATGDEDWLAEYGAEIVIETARFWASRVFFSKRKDAYVINQVTGPDEYSEMVNNDCYTNMMVAWTLEYATQVASLLQREFPGTWKKLSRDLQWAEDELERWTEIAARMYIPYDKELGLHPQDDGFLDLDDIDIRDVPADEFPLESCWAWPTVLRYQALKQPAVVLATYLLNNRFTTEQKRAAYEYYEPRTTHDSSLSPSIHSIMAAELGMADKAYAYFLRSARLDLDDAKPDGIHMANAGGAWMAMVNGFAGLRLVDGKIHFSPTIPSLWQSYSFNILLKGRRVGVHIDGKRAQFTLLAGEPLELHIKNQTHALETSIRVDTGILNTKELKAYEQESLLR